MKKKVGNERMEEGEQPGPVTEERLGEWDDAGKVTCKVRRWRESSKKGR